MLRVLRQSSDEIVSNCSSSYVTPESRNRKKKHLNQTSELSISRNSDFSMVDSPLINNDRVRYYYNKTLATEKPISRTIDSLNKLQNGTFAYLHQVPVTGDYSTISTLFELIPTVSNMIDWESMNHSCYWDDFCRETKQMMLLLERVNGAALKCTDTITEIFTQAQVLFQGIGTNDKNLHINRVINDRQVSDNVYEDPNGQSIQINWSKPGDDIQLSWFDADGGLLKVSLKTTGTGFRLRFLRHIIYHARACLELAYLTFMKVNVALNLDIPIGKLEKCQVSIKHLTPQEESLIFRAKQEFDQSLDHVWLMVSRFKFQAFQLLKYKTTFKGLRKSWLYAPKTVPTFQKLTLTIDGSLLMRVMSFRMQAQAKEESFDFTVFPDRTEDIISKIEDLLTVDFTNFKELQMLLNIFQHTFPTEKRNFTEKELVSIKREIKMIFGHRFHVRHYLKECLGLFETHAAFHKIKQNLMIPTKSSPLQRHSKSELNVDTSMDASESFIEEADIANNNCSTKTDRGFWITIPGEIKMIMDDAKGVMVQFFPEEDAKSYKELSTDEKVSLNVRLIRQLLSFTAYEQCWMKIRLARVTETKSLVKRLKIKDRLNADLQNILSEHNKHANLMLELTKAMRFLKTLV